ncbi:MAG: glycosyltransferase family 39 protein, partial [Bacteroidota bacterium]
FWEMMQEYAKWYWKPLFFIGLGLGLLTKGPITALLALPPIVFWVLFHGKAVTTLKRMPLLFGAILTLGIALPWYAAAERNTPGFLDYFFIGEHFKRFFDSEWAGDKYGFPKSQPLGAIWWFLIVFALPWILFVLGKLWKEHKRIRKNEWVLFLVFWLLWTPLFFTFSKSLIHPYIMPVTTPIALLATYWFSTLKRKGIVVKTTLSLTFLVSIVVLMATHLGYTAYYAPTDKYLIQEHTWHGDVIYHLHSKSYSSQFYSKGRIRSVPLSDLNEKIHNDQEAFKIIITHGQMGNLPEKVQNKLQLLGQNNRKGIYGFKGRFP